MPESSPTTKKEFALDERNRMSTRLELLICEIEILFPVEIGHIVPAGPDVVADVPTAGHFSEGTPSALATYTGRGAISEITRCWSNGKTLSLPIYFMKWIGQVIGQCGCAS